MLEKSELISLLNQTLNQQAKLRKGGNELVYFCPNCHHHKRKLECCIDESSKFFGAFHCWTCHFSGNLYDLLKTSKVSKASYETLAKLTSHIKKVNYNKPKSEESVISLPEEFHPISIPLKTPEYKNAIAYLKRRGILEEDIIRYNIGYCETGDYAYHIIIPSYDASGHLNFFVGRRYYDSEGTIPYKKPEVSMDIIGFEIFINWNEPVILTEAPWNAITIRNNAIPLFGKYPSSSLYKTMITSGVKDVYVFLDADAMKDSLLICKKILNLNMTPHLVKMVGGKDPNQIGFKNSWDCIRNAVPIDESDLFKYKMEM